MVLGLSVRGIVSLFIVSILICVNMLNLKLLQSKQEYQDLLEGSNSKKVCKGVAMISVISILTCDPLGNLMRLHLQSQIGLEAYFTENFQMNAPSLELSRLQSCIQRFFGPMYNIVHKISDLYIWVCIYIMLYFFY